MIASLTVAEFVTERLYEDEMMARAAGVGTWVAGERCVWRVSAIAEVDIVTDGLDGDGGTESPEIAEHIARHDPARALARCAAMRRIVSEHYDVNDGDCSTCVKGLWGYPTHGGSRIEPWPCPTLRALASIWADHPDWREEWTG